MATPTAGTLKYIRYLLRSGPYGRTDLVNSDYADKGSDFYINAAQRLLERLQPSPNRNATLEISLDEGDYTFSVSNLVSIQRLRRKESYPTLYPDAAIPQIYDPNLDLYNNFDLVYKDPDWIIKMYPYLGETDPGDPMYYTIWTNREVASETALNAADGSTSNKTTILVMPPAKEITDEGVVTTYDLVLFGAFKSAELSDDDDTSYWSEMHPELLVDATMFKITKDPKWLTTLQLELRTIDFDVIEQDMIQGTIMEG